MRLTLLLQKQRLGWWFKKKWEAHKNRKIIEVCIPEKLKERGVEIVDALEYTKPQKTSVKWEIPEPWNYHDPDEKTRDHPDWHDRACFFFMNETNLLEGEAHVQNLTKTLILRGLPKQLQGTYDHLDVSSVDDIALKYLENCLIHDAYQVKLPRKVDKERPCHVFQRVYGIPLERRITLLLMSFLRLVAMEGKNPSALNYDVIFDAKASCPVEKDGDLIQYRVEAPFLVTALKELPQFADENEVLDTLKTPLPDIYPIKPILDLKEENIYKLYDFCPVIGKRKRFIHTLFLRNTFSPDDWSHSQLIARAIGVCHGFALAQARHLFGNDISTLPHPISVQCIQTDSQMFDFVAYQLNTVKADGLDGIKNLAWVDDNHKLFEKCERVDGNICLENFNNDVVRRFLSYFLLQ